MVNGLSYDPQFVSYSNLGNLMECFSRNKISGKMFDPLNVNSDTKDRVERKVSGCPERITQTTYQNGHTTTATLDQTTHTHTHKPQKIRQTRRILSEVGSKRYDGDQVFFNTGWCSVEKRIPRTT